MKRAFIGVLLASLFAAGVGCTPALADKKIDWDSKLSKARQLEETNNVEEAMKICQDYMKKHPEAGAVHTEMGRCLKKRGKLMQAKQEFKRSTEVDPGYADAWYELGAMNEFDREYQAAVDNFERYLQIEPYSDRKQSVEDRINFCKSKQ